MYEAAEKDGELLPPGKMIPFRDGEIDLAEHCEWVGSPISVDLEGLERLLSDATPVATDVLAALSRGDHVVLRLPEGKRLDDLMDRKTPGLEGYKHPVVKAADGRAGGVAALRRAKPSAEELADLTLRVASFVVGQANMAMVERDLRGIREGIDEIVSRMDMKNLSDLRGFVSRLDEFQRSFGHKGKREDDRRAIANRINDIITSIVTIHQDEMAIIDSATTETLAGNLDVEAAHKRIDRISSAAWRCHYALCVEAYARLLLIVYEGDLTEENTALQSEEVRMKSEALERKLDDSLTALTGGVGKKGASEKTWRRNSYPTRLGSVITLPIALPMAVLGIKAQQEIYDRDRIDEMISRVDVPTDDVAPTFAERLEWLRLLHGDADALEIHEGTVRPLLLKNSPRTGQTV